MKPTDEKTLLRAAQQLRQRNESAIDELTGARLRAARLRALEQSGATNSRNQRWIIGAGIAALFVATVLWFAPMPSTNPIVPEPVLANIDSDNLDLMTDLEFYEWLASQDAS